MEDWKDGIISVEAEKIIPITKGEWKEFQKQMRMEGDYFYMVGNKKYVHYEDEDYLRMEDYRQELDRAREEGREEIRQLLRDKEQVKKFLKENPRFYRGKKIETSNITTLTKF